MISTLPGASVYIDLWNDQRIFLKWRTSSKIMQNVYISCQNLQKLHFNILTYFNIYFKSRVGQSNNERTLALLRPRTDKVKSLSSPSLDSEVSMNPGGGHFHIGPCGMYVSEFRVISFSWTCQKLMNRIEFCSSSVPRLGFLASLRQNSSSKNYFWLNQFIFDNTFPLKQ